MAFPDLQVDAATRHNGYARCYDVPPLKDLPVTMPSDSSPAAEQRDDRTEQSALSKYFLEDGTYLHPIPEPRHAAMHCYITGAVVACFALALLVVFGLTPELLSRQQMFGVAAGVLVGVGQFYGVRCSVLEFDGKSARLRVAELMALAVTLLFFIGASGIELPIFVAIVGTTWVPLAVARLWHWRLLYAPDLEPRLPRVQFSLAFLFWLMTAVALLVVVAQAIQYSGGAPAMVLLSLLLAFAAVGNASLMWLLLPPRRLGWMGMVLGLLLVPTLGLVVLRPPGAFGVGELLLAEMTFCHGLAIAARLSGFRLVQVPLLRLGQK